MRPRIAFDRIIQFPKATRRRARTPKALPALRTGNAKRLQVLPSYRSLITDHSGVRVTAADAAWGEPSAVGWAEAWE
jgi:hypothetical protein